MMGYDGDMESIMMVDDGLMMGYYGGDVFSIRGKNIII